MTSISDTISILFAKYYNNKLKKEFCQIVNYVYNQDRYTSITNIIDVLTDSFDSLNLDFVMIDIDIDTFLNTNFDLSIVRNCLSQVDMIVKSLDKKDFIVVIKSTVPPGTTEMLNKENENIHIVFNPEFLTEANAVEDYKNQNRIIVGGDRPYTSKVKNVFEKAFPQVTIVKTSSTIAEMIKYVTNTFLATKVSFANEMYQICQGLDIDYDKVIEYARYDNRLGNSHWSVPGPDGDFGYGGHCFPKDIAALQYVAKEMNVSTTVLNASIEKNKEVRTDKDWEKQIGRAVSED
jgi:UDPglucose 6-dehydrogenase